jgi:hypothetical protein
MIVVWCVDHTEAEVTMVDMEVDSRSPVTMTPTDSSSSSPCQLTGTNPIYLRDQVQALLPPTALGVCRLLCETFLSNSGIE